jgi:hypothetical protein
VTKRRSLDDALTPEEQAFLDATPVAAKPAEKPVQPKKENPPMAKPALKTEYFADLDSADQIPIAGLVSLNTRIDPELSTALLRASMERKIRRLPKSSKTEIVGEAIAHWLKAHGYLA